MIRARRDRFRAGHRRLRSRARRAGPKARLDLLRRSIAPATESGAHEFVARGYTNLGELLYRYGRYPELERLLVEGLAFTRVRGFWSHTYNLRVHDALLSARRSWSAAADRWGGLGDRYERALELADSGRPDAVRAAARELDDLGASAAAGVGRRGLRRLGVSIPRGPRSATRDNPGGLTQRQLDIARLLATGSTNAEIAAELVLSVRTVHHHVSTILAKLGVDTRRAATAIIRTWPPSPESGPL